MPPNLRSGPVRARDLRSNIKEMGFERGIVYTFELFLEEFASHRQDMRSMAELLSQCINQVEQMITVGEGMQGKLTEMQRIMNQGNENGDA